MKKIPGVPTDPCKITPVGANPTILLYLLLVSHSEIKGNKQIRVEY